jgi:hypothetical protein
VRTSPGASHGEVPVIIDFHHESGIIIGRK